MKSVQPSTNSGFGLVEDEDTFWVSFLWPGASKVEANGSPNAPKLHPNLPAPIPTGTG